MKKVISLILSLIALLSLVGCGCGQNDSDVFLEYYNSKVELYKAENKSLTDPVDIVFLGDSLTDGYDVSRFYPEYKVLNRGISGDTTVGLENRLDVSLYAVQPKVAVMLIGANNMDSMLENYEEILIGFKENVPNTKIILLSLTSMSGEWGRKNQLAAYNNVQIKMLANKYGYEYVDLYSALLNLETGEIYDEYTTDGGHLTEKGYEVLTKQITPVVDKILKPEINN